MKKFIVCVGVIALLTGLVDTVMALTLVDSGGGEFVVYDEATKQYWYQDLSYFTFHTLGEQLSAIDALNANSYATFTDWHLATYSEMSTLWGYGANVIINYFTRSGWEPGTDVWAGRYQKNNDCPGEYPTCNTASICWDWYWDWDQLMLLPYLNANLQNGASESLPVLNVGAWVVTENAHPAPWLDSGSSTVPEPATMLLMGIGFLMLAAIRRKLS